mgnify:CR=1 FL=1
MAEDKQIDLPNVKTSINISSNFLTDNTATITYNATNSPGGWHRNLFEEGIEHQPGPTGTPPASQNQNLRTMFQNMGSQMDAMLHHIGERDRSATPVAMVRSPDSDITSGGGWYEDNGYVTPKRKTPEAVAPSTAVHSMIHESPCTSPRPVGPDG